jgi:hypothetical protein
MQVKMVLTALMGLFLFLSCSKTSTEKLDEMVSADGELKFSGSFQGVGSEKVTGEAKIFLTNNNYMLKLQNFNTTNGPDLKVYLSKASTPQSFISLGI